MHEGLPPNGAARLLRLRCAQAEARAIADIMVETFDPAEVAAAAFEESGQERGPPDWSVTVYFQFDPDEEAVRALIAAATSDALAKAAVFDAVAQRDWVAGSLEGLRPVEAGRFLVHGAHDRAWATKRPYKMALEIEAALAFGTGHHGTTRGCLLMLDKVLRRRRPGRALDVGAGTGVLAMAAAKALKRRVWATEVDPVAVAAALANARLNGLSPLLRVLLSHRPDDRRIIERAPFDLIMANILAAPLRQLAPRIARVSRPGADLILSGLVPSDAAGVISVYGAHRFRLRDRVDLEGWATLHMRRLRPPPIAQVSQRA